MRKKAESGVRIGLISIFALLLCASAILPRASATDPPATAPYTPPTWHAVVAGDAPVRVLVAEHQTMLAWKGQGTVTVRSLAIGKAVFTSGPGEQVGLVSAPEMGGFSLREHSTNILSVTPPLQLESDLGVTVWTPSPDQWTTYWGLVLLVATGGPPSSAARTAPDVTFNVVRALPLETYLRHVVGAEMPATFPPAALRAQAIVVRTFALRHLGACAAEGADLMVGDAEDAANPSDSDDCQVPLSDDDVPSAVAEAITHTSGLVLLAGDEPADVFYHAACGGATADAGYVWGPGAGLPYLGGITDIPGGTRPTPWNVDAAIACPAYDAAAPGREWTRTYTADAMNRLVLKNLPVVTGDDTARVGKVSAMTVETRAPDGRVASLRIEGDGASLLILGDAIRQLVGEGPESLPSTFFDLTVEKSPDGSISVYRFHGVGVGNGVGLCQWGAAGRAAAGQGTRDILHAYFPGTHLSDEPVPATSPNL